MNIGQNIINLRKKNNLTQQDLAKLINVSPKTISSYENNRNLPNIEILVLMAEAMNTSIDEIVGFNKNAEEINLTYQKKNLKKKIINFFFISLLFIIPSIFYLKAGYTSISSLMAQIHSTFNFTAEESNKLSQISNEVFGFFKIFSLEYFIYIILLFINYILYKKSYKKTLLLINGILFLLIVVDILGGYSGFDGLIFLVDAIIGLLGGFTLLKKSTSN